MDDYIARHLSEKEQNTCWYNMVDREVSTRDLDDVSTVLFRAGYNTARRNPVIVSSYLLGLVLCFFFSGISLTAEQMQSYEASLRNIDFDEVNEVAYELQRVTSKYRQSKGWFSCDSTCQEYKALMESLTQEYNKLHAMQEQALSDAKAKLGILSTIGIDETRQLFWRRFSQGRGFAQRQTKWDALFMGISAMGRDEGLFSYLLRVLFSLLFNFTIGMIGAVIAFITSLFSLIYTYQTPIYTAFVYFGLASLAAISFALTWMVMLYVAAAGTVFVGVKVLGANMRIEEGRGPRSRIRFHQRSHYQ